VKELAHRFAKAQGIEIVGLHIHVGSQITNLDPLRSAPQAIVNLARELRDDGIAIDHLDLGGGLGVSYDGGVVPSAQDYAARCFRSSRNQGSRSSSSRGAASSRPPARC
jgi:diaminopimelate decarboxylase